MFVNKYFANFAVNKYFASFTVKLLENFQDWECEIFRVLILYEHELRAKLSNLY